MERLLFIIYDHMLTLLYTAMSMAGFICRAFNNRSHLGWPTTSRKLFVGWQRLSVGD